MLWPTCMIPVWPQLWSDTSFLFITLYFLHLGVFLQGQQSVIFIHFQCCLTLVWPQDATKQWHCRGYSFCVMKLCGFVSNDIPHRSLMGGALCIKYSICLPNFQTWSWNSHHMRGRSAYIHCSLTTSRVWWRTTHTLFGNNLQFIRFYQIKALKKLTRKA